ncbi:MAG: hypothetical protein DHS20C15_13410 [Planctomycetota bacterium]|nr:MAG: hypothetical protein DHS20C15_13410 [Planctomycetota bacterium]
MPKPCARWLALALLLPLPLASLRAQDDGFNFHILSSFGDTTYFGVGAGGDSVPGADITGYWVGGEDLQGATMTSLGEFGYRQAGLRVSACVFNLGLNSKLDFPAIMTLELADTDINDHFNFHHPYNFLRPGCAVGTIVSTSASPITTSIFGVPLGVPAGTTVDWIRYDISGGFQSLGIPTGVFVLTPNAGLVPSATTSGTIAIVSVASAAVAISAAGCYNFDLHWVSLATSSLPAFDDINGWWTQLTASRDGNQYWTVSTSNTNLVGSHSASSAADGTVVTRMPVMSELELQYFSLDPSTNHALAPASVRDDQVYYSSGLPGAINQGFDLGHHAAISASATQGAHTLYSGAGGFNPGPGFNTQDVNNAALNIGPNATGGAVTNTLGFVTWNNNTYSTPGGTGARLTWVQADVDMLANGTLDPSEQTSVELFFGQVRVPVRVPALVGSWPSAFTLQLFPIFAHTTVDETGNPLWPDPSGNAGGAMGVKPIVGQSVHVSIFGATGFCAFAGLPIGLAYGSSGLSAPSTGPLVWDPNQNRVSFGRSILIYD